MPTYGSATVVCVASMTNSVTFGNTTTETTIFSKAVPFGILEPLGTNLHLRLQGYASGSSDPAVLTLRTYYGTSVMTTLTATPGNSTTQIGFAAAQDITTVGTGSAMGQGWASYFGTTYAYHSGHTQSKAFTTGATVTVAVKGQYAVAAAGNSFTATNLLMDVGGLV